MSIALAWRYKYYKQESELQFQKNREHQERILKETAVYQEKEMQRISSMLHDSVGASLGLLRLESDNMELNEEARMRLANNITKIGNQVREMSHQFSPILLQEKGLYSSIEALVLKITQNSNLDIQFEWIGSKSGISSSFEILLYRIVQEILQNIIKHSNAENAFLQIIVEQKFISVYAENDGVLVKHLYKEEGIGLKSIEKLILLLDGQIQINNSENESFSISIDFNLTEYA